MIQNISWSVVLESPVMVVIASAITAAIGWVTVKVFNHFKNKPFRVHKKLRKAYTDSMRAIAIVYSTILALEKQPEIDRVFLLELSNGGHKPMPGSKITAKGIYMEVDEKKLGATKEELFKRYEETQVDDKYIMMCIEAEQNGRYIFNVKDHADCLLKSIYIREGIEHAEIFHIHTDYQNEVMFILSIASMDKKQTFSHYQTRAYIETSIRLIKDNFKAYRK